MCCLSWVLGTFTLVYLALGMGVRYAVSVLVSVNKTIDHHNSWPGRIVANTAVSDLFHKPSREFNHEAHVRPNSHWRRGDATQRANGSVHTGCKQHQRNCNQICVVASSAGWVPLSYEQQKFMSGRKCAVFCRKYYLFSQPDWSHDECHHGS